MDLLLHFYASMGGAAPASCNQLPEYTTENNNCLQCKMSWAADLCTEINLNVGMFNPLQPYTEIYSGSRDSNRA